MPSVCCDEKILRQKSEPVASVEEATALIQKLEAALKQIDNGVGLAAVQIRIPKQVGVIQGRDGNIYLINPVLESAEEEFVFGREGCLSKPGLYRNTKRFRHYTIKNQVIDGDEFREEIQYYFYGETPDEPGHMGLEAIAVQHEMDHFDGKMIVDQEEIKGKTVERGKEKVGRNDPCPCGSGKKFKKCCINKGMFD